MTREKAEEYAKTMTYEDALHNLSRARAIPYRKATLIKVNELIKALSQEPTIGQLFSCEELEELRSKIWKQVEQEPCDDAISRDAVINAICDYVAFEEYEDKSHTFTIRPLEKRIDALPPVTRKTGKWIGKDFRKEEYVLTGKCSVCGRRSVIGEFCSYCGHRMYEPQESEE